MWQKVDLSIEGIAKENEEAAAINAAQISTNIYNATKSKGRPKKMIVAPKKDMVNSPAHYIVGGVETIDFIEAKGLGYHLGNCIKYISRADYKGDRLEDLKKARWYLQREIDRLEKAQE